MIHINQRKIQYKGIKQKACLVQNIDEFNILEEKLLNSGFNYKRYEHDFDFFKSSSKHARCNYVDHSLEVIECLNCSDIVSGELIEIKKIEILFMYHTEVLETPVYKQIDNPHFYLLLVHIIDDSKFDFDTIDFYNEEDRQDVLNNYTLYPSGSILD